MRPVWRFGIIKTRQVTRERTVKWNTQKSSGSDGKYEVISSKMLRELANVTVRPLISIFKRSW